MDKKQLRELREQYELTQGELADILQVAPNTVSRWELGTREIPAYLDEDSINPPDKIKMLFGKSKDLDIQIADAIKNGWEVRGERLTIPINMKSNVVVPKLVSFGQVVVKRKLAVYKSEKSSGKE